MLSVKLLSRRAGAFAPRARDTHWPQALNRLYPTFLIGRPPSRAPGCRRAAEEPPGGQDTLVLRGVAVRIARRLVPVRQKNGRSIGSDRSVLCRLQRLYRPA